jgi:3-phenylpropionate/trans-cinnamate dioxygenase ferredoxin reductase subunit
VTTARHIVVVGGGPAAVAAAMAAKAADPTAVVAMLTEETYEPYEKPPLSKAVLLGRAQVRDAFIAGPAGLEALGVIVENNARCVAIDRTAHQVTVADGRHFGYDSLVLATGGVVRECAPFNFGTPKVHYLRTADDAQRLRRALVDARNVIVIGAGLIGLEVAAALAELGLNVTIIESAQRIMSRVCDDDIAALVQAEHARHDVDIRVGESLRSVERADDLWTIETSKGERLIADLIVVGIGVSPNDSLAVAAGLTTSDGIVVDECCRTSDPNVFAAGDAVAFPGPYGAIRLENWRHAQEQGAVAGANAAGGADAYCPTPSFWSEQYGLYIQGVGWPGAAAESLVDRHISETSFVRFKLSGSSLTGAFGINARKEIAAARRLIDRGSAVIASDLADPQVPVGGRPRNTSPMSAAL